MKTIFQLGPKNWKTLDDLKPGFENYISARKQEPATLDDLKPDFENYILVRNQEPATLDD